MAKVFATRAYDMTAYNFHALDSLADLAGYNDQPYRVGSTTYADRIEAVMKNGSGSLVFASPSIAATPGGDVVGNITGIFHSSNTTAAGVWAGIQGIRMDIQALGAAWDTPGMRDDQALLARMLSGSDTFDLSSQADKAKGYGGNDSMLGKGGQDKLWGGAGNDTVDGGAGNDMLLGDAGNDTLKAGGGADVLVGGDGRDILVGGLDGSADRFVFNDWIDSGPGATMRDQIRNFTRRADRVDLRPMDADENSEETNDRFDWSGTRAEDHSVWWSPTNGGVLLRADISGDAIHEFELFVKGVSALSQGDIHL